MAVITALKIAALNEAVREHSWPRRPARGEDADAFYAAKDRAITASARRFLAWLRGPQSIRLLVGPVTDQTAGAAVALNPEGTTMQIQDHQQFDLSVTALDTEGQPTTAGALVWTSDNEDAVPVNVSEDGATFHVVAGNPGSATVRVEMTKDDGEVISATEAIDVVPGGAATIAISEGPVTDQP
jgi:uncharacterized membrane protein YidH (DUF202 family)